VNVSSLDASLFDQHVIKWPQADYPYCARCPLRLTYPSCQLQCVQALFDHLEEFADEISAVLVEPAIGARGYIFPPDEFFQRLRRATQAAGILLIADEIQTGLGRCGEWLLSQQQGWQADLILLGKSLGGGLAPISVVIGRAEILESLAPGSESETFAASPLACAVGLEVLNQLRHGGWIERGSQIGQHLRQQLTSRLLDMRRTDTRVFDQSNTELSGYVVEGCGANCVCEFPDSGAARLYAESCFQRGLLVQLTGPELTRVVMLPALTMSDDELQEVFQRLPS
jgi:4-aminobutyrate aminotransferase-like enzyme